MYTGISDECAQKLKENGRTFSAKLEFASGTADSGIKSITVRQQSTSGTQTVELGGAVAAQLEVEMAKPSLTVAGQEFTLSFGLLLDEGTTEYIPIGTFTAQKPTETYDGIIKFTAYDRMYYKLKYGYYTEITSYPADGRDILREIADMAGITIANLDSLPDGIMVSMREETTDDGTAEVEPFSGCTYQEAVGYLAQMYGCFATFNRDGDLEFRWYTESGYEVSTSRMGADAECDEAEYELGMIECTVGDETLTAGEGASGIAISNPVMTQEILDLVWEDIGGMSYYPASVSFIGDPCLDLGDIISISKMDGTAVSIPVMGITQEYDGGLWTGAESYGDMEETESAGSGGSVSSALSSLTSELVTAKEVIANKASVAYLEANYITAEEIETAYVRTDNLEAVVAEFGYVKTDELEAAVAKFGYLKADELEAAVAEFGYLKATDAEFTSLSADVATIKEAYISTETVDTLLADYVKTSELEASVAGFGYVKTTELDAEIADLGYVKSTYIQTYYLTAQEIESTYVTADTLKTSYLDADTIASTYIKADLTNFTTTMMGTLLADAGVVTNMAIKDGCVTGVLSSVTINADTITTGTLSVERLLIVGEDGIIYQINAQSSGLSETELTDEAYQNYINGTVIVANSITATQIAAGTITATEIAANTITASKMNVSELSSITADVGLLTAGILQSQNYVAGVSGICIDLDAGTIDCEDLIVTASERILSTVSETYATLEDYTSLTKSLGGAVVSVTAYFAISDSADEYPDLEESGGKASYVGIAQVGLWLVGYFGWIPKMPAYKDGDYVWMCHLITYASGEEEWTRPTLVVDGSLSSGIVEVKKTTAAIQTLADSIIQTVTATSAVWYTGDYAVAATSYGTPDDVGVDASLYEGAYYLDQEIGYLYYSDGSSWSKADELTSTAETLQSLIGLTEGNILLEVSKTYVTQDEYDSLSIGGTNLLPGTKDFSDGIYKGEVQEETYLGLTVIGLSLDESYSGPTSYGNLCLYKEFIEPEAGGQYTLSFYAKGSGTVNSYFYTNAASAAVTSQGVTTGQVSNGAVSITLSDTWTRYWVTWTVRDDVSGAKDLVPMRVLAGTSGYICGVKFEKGNIATDWSPAPEDAEDYTDSKVSASLVLSISEEDGVKYGVLSANADKIRLTGDEIIIDTDNFKLGDTFEIHTDNFDVDSEGDATFGGTLKSPGGTIGGLTIGTGAMYYNTTGMTSTTAGIYIGTDGFRQYSSSSKYVNIKDGALTSYGADINKATIGDWTLDGAIYNGTASMNSTAAGTYIGTDGIRQYVSSNKFLNIENSLIDGVGNSSIIGIDGSTYYPYFTMTGGIWDLYAYGYSMSTSPVGGVAISPSGISFFMGSDTAWMSLNNTNKRLTIESSGSLHVSGSTEVKALQVGGAATLASTLDVTGAATLSSTLSVNSTITTNGTIIADGNVRIGNGDETGSTAAYINTYWFDETRHSIIHRHTDGLTAYFGWNGTNSTTGETYASVSVLRGQTVKYQNSSGTTSLSDERLKKDWKGLDDYDNFFDALNPQAFRYIDGVSGRYHLGFGAQSVEQALTDCGLSSTDFAGYIKMPVCEDSEEYHGYSEEYGLIYTEFIALLTDQIQKLKARVTELELMQAAA